MLHTVIHIYIVCVCCCHFGWFTLCHLSGWFMDVFIQVEPNTTFLQGEIHQFPTSWYWGNPDFCWLNPIKQTMLLAS